MSQAPLSPNTIRCFADSYCIDLKYYKINVPKELGNTFNLEINQYGRERLKYGNRFFNGFPDLINADDDTTEFSTSGELADIKYQDIRPINSFGRKFGCLDYIVKMNCIKDCKPGGTNANALGYLGPNQIPFYISSAGEYGNFIYEYRNRDNWIPDGDNTLSLHSIYYLEDLSTLNSLSDFEDIYPSGSGFQNNETIFSEDSYSVTDWQDPTEIGFEKIGFEQAEELGYYEMPSELTAAVCNKFKNITVIIMNWGNLVVDESLGVIDNECLGYRSEYNKGSNKISDNIKEKMEEYFNESDINITIKIVNPHQNVAQGYSVISRFINEPRNYYRTPNHLESFNGDLGPFPVDIGDYLETPDTVFPYNDKHYNYSALFFPAGEIGNDPVDPEANLQYFEEISNIWAVNYQELAKGPMPITRFDDLPFCESVYVEPTYELRSRYALINNFTMTYNQFVTSINFSEQQQQNNSGEIQDYYEKYLSLLLSKSPSDIFVRKVYSPEDIAQVVVDSTDEDTDLCVIFDDGLTPINHTGFLKDYESPVYLWPYEFSQFGNTLPEFLEDKNETIWLDKFIEEVGTQRTFELFFTEFNQQREKAVHPDVDYDGETSFPFNPIIHEHEFIRYQDWPEEYPFGNSFQLLINKASVDRLEVIPNIDGLDSFLDCAKEAYYDFYGDKMVRVLNNDFLNVNCGLVDHTFYTNGNLFPDGILRVDCPYPGWSYESQLPLGVGVFIYLPYNSSEHFGIWPVPEIQFEFPNAMSFSNVKAKPTSSCGEEISRKMHFPDAPVWQVCDRIVVSAILNEDDDPFYELHPEVEEEGTYENWVESYIEYGFDYIYYSNDNNIYSDSEYIFPPFSSKLLKIVNGVHPYKPTLSRGSNTLWYNGILESIYQFISKPIISSVQIEPIFRDGPSDSDDIIYSTRCNDRPISSLYIVEPNESFYYDSFDSVAQYIGIESEDFIGYYDGILYFHNSDPGNYFREVNTQVIFSPVQGRTGLYRIYMRNYYGAQFEYVASDVPDYATAEEIDNIEEIEVDFLGTPLFIGDGTIQERIFTLTKYSINAHKTRDICNIPRQIKVTIE